MTSSPSGAGTTGLAPLRPKGLVGAAVRPVVVTGILVVHDGAQWLKECLDALSRQTRPLDRLVIVDTGSTDTSVRIAARHALIRQVIGDIEAIAAPAETSFGEAVGRAVGQLPSGQIGSDPGGVTASRAEKDDLADMASRADRDATGADWLWLLHDDSAPDPAALAHLLDAARRSPSVGVAGPKLVTWDDPSRLLEVGSVITRAGRRVGGPSPGEPDQGQHDHRSDVLGVSTSGMLIRRDVFETVGGFDPAFRKFRDDLDLCWRAQLAGHRVVVAPRARMREAAASTSRERFADLSPEAARALDRRHGRQVALARCSLYAAPFLAIWIALASIGSATVLLLAKRPRGAWAALGDCGALLTPWRPISARWRARGTRRIRRRDLRGLFASPKVGFGYTLDTIHEGVSVGPVPQDDEGSRSARSLESGPVSEDAESLERPAPGAARRVLRNPGFLAVVASTLLALLTWRSLFRTLVPTGSGITGGELLPLSGSAPGLWHAWLDGWHGAGLGNALASPPYLPVLAAGAWVLEHLPFIGSPTSSVGVSIAWLLATALPVSALTAYLGARVVTRAPWPRAWAALAWASLATLTTAVAGGRLGAVVAHILLPLVAAGFVRTARRSARTSTTFGTALALAVTGAFNPALALVGAVAALVLLVVGHGLTRLRAAVLLVVPIALMGPWILQVLDKPVLLLTGPGLTVWRGVTAAPWQLELLHPGGPGSYPVLLSAPIVLAGVLAMARREAARGPMTVFAVLTAAGLALGVASANVIVALIPKDLAGAGQAITVWPGTGLDLAAVALIAAVLRTFERGPGRLAPSRFSWRRILFPAVVLAAVLGVVGSMVMAGWVGVGEELNRQVPSTPAVASDQAHSSVGNRLLAMTLDGAAIGYRLVGSEPGPVVRDLPAAGVAQDPLLAAAVKAVVETNDVASANAARDALADLGIGFVTYRGAVTDPIAAQLDATAGVVRLSSNRGLILWRVLPRENVVRSSRLRLEDANGVPLASIAVQGDHGRTDVELGPATPGAPSDSSPGSVGRRLVVAEPKLWARYARVTFASQRLAAVAGAGQPTYVLPSQAGQLSITVTPAHQRWRWAQLGLLIVVLFLAAPFGATRSTRPAGSNPSIGPAGSNPSIGPAGSNPSIGPVGSDPSIGPVGSDPSIGPVGSNPSIGPVGSNPSIGLTGSSPSIGPVGSNPLAGSGKTP